MLGIFFFLDFRNANGCGARYTPLRTLLVHPSPLPLRVADVDLWRHLYVRDGIVSTDPLSGRVAAVCHSKFGPGVVSGRAAGVLPIVTRCFGKAEKSRVVDAHDRRNGVLCGQWSA